MFLYPIHLELDSYCLYGAKHTDRKCNTVLQIGLFWMWKFKKPKKKYYAKKREKQLTQKNQFYRHERITE